MLWTIAYIVLMIFFSVIGAKKMSEGSSTNEES